MPPTPFDDRVPIPPRYWWIKRIIVASVGLMVALVALRLWWGWYANRLLQAEIDRIIAAGEPIYPEDFDPKEDIPDDQNAAKLLQRAVAALDLHDEHSFTFQAIWDQHDAVSEHIPGLISLLKDNADALQLVREARSLSAVDWGLRIRTPAVVTSHFSFTDHRTLAKLLYIAADYHSCTGDADGLANVCLDSLALGDHIIAQPTLVSQLVGWAVQALTLNRIEELVLVENTDCGAAPDNTFDKALLRQLIQSVADTGAMEAGLVWALCAERMFHVDIQRGVVSGSQKMSSFFGWQGGVQAQIPDVVWRFVLAPAVTLDMARVLSDTSSRIHAAHKLQWHDALKYEVDNDKETLQSVVLKPFSIYFNQSINRSIEIFRRYLAQRRLAAVGLAVRLFRLDRGRLPKSLDELVPDYLARLPLDPQSNPSKSFGYLPDADLPIVYGVSDNGVDDIGRIVGRKEFTRFREGDLPFFINGVPSEPETEEDEDESDDAVDDDGDVEGEEGNDADGEDIEEQPQQR